MRFLRALSLLTLLVGGMGCGDRDLDVEVQLVTLACDQTAGIDPLGGVLVKEIRVRAYHLPPGGEDRDFEGGLEFEEQIHLDSASLTLAGIPMGPHRYLMVEGLNQNGGVVSRGMAGPLDFSEGGSMKTTVFLRRTDTFTPVSSADSPGTCSQMRRNRWGHTSTLLNDGRVLIAGGYSSSDGKATPQRTTEIFDPSTGTFAEGPSMRDGRAFHTATRIPGTSLIVLAGGEKFFMPESVEDVLNTAEIYDEDTGLFTQLPMHARRTRHVAAVAPGGDKVLLIGGAQLEEVGQGTTRMATLESTEVFDAGLKTIYPGPSLDRGRADHSVAVLPNGTAVVAGGQDLGGFVKEVEVFRYEMGTWRRPQVTTVGELTTPRLRPLVGPVGDHIFFGGGVTEIPNSSSWVDHLQYAKATNVGETLNMSELPPIIAEGGGLDSARADGALVQLPNGRSLIAGGAAPYGLTSVATVKKAEILEAGETPSDPPETRETRGEMRQGRYFASYVLLADGTVLITGGVDRNQSDDPVYLRSAEVYQPDYRTHPTDPFQ